MTLLGFSYNNSTKASVTGNKDLEFIDDIKGQYKVNPILTMSLSICLFSMAGIPPMIGFFGKQMVLYSSISSEYYFVSFVVILVSVVSASYYLKVVKVLFDDNASNLFSHTSYEYSLSNVQSLIIAVLTITVTGFIINTDILLNSVKLLTLTVFNT